LAFGANGPIDWTALVTNNDTVTAKFAARVVCLS